MTDKLLARRSVLVVEDEMLVLMMTEGMLEDLGCETIAAAATVEQALALIDTRTFDLALVDMNLNGSTTHAVADALATRGVPFAFATGYSGRDADDRHSDRPLLKKPFHEQGLADMLTGLLAD